MLNTLSDLGLVLLGFTLIIVVHELGHFLAARWAGIRVLAFAVGFGPALVSFRKGLGVRAGSSEAEYHRLLKEDREGTSQHAPARVSPTEYRLNALFLGGYVKMLGQDDSDPSAVSDAPDSYQTCSPGKRMIVISAGVVMNIILAAALFCVVFFLGLKTEAPRIGFIAPGPASGRGLMTGDRVTSIDGRQIESFNDINLAIVMARAGKDLEFTVERQGLERPLTYWILPREDPDSRMLMIGVGPMASLQLPKPTSEAQYQALASLLVRAGGPALKPGMALTKVNSRAAASVYDLADAVRKSEGKGVDASFVDQQTHEQVEVHIGAVTELQSTSIHRDKEGAAQVEHLLGIAPPLRIDSVDAKGAASGLQAGDIVAQIGAVPWPSVAAGIAQIRANAGKTITMTVLREESGVHALVELKTVPVHGDGTIGFNRDDAREVGAWVGAWPGGVPSRDEATPLRDRFLPGTRIVAVNDHPVSSLREVREALRPLLHKSMITKELVSAEIRFTVELPRDQREGAFPASSPVAETVTVELGGIEGHAIGSLGWEPKLPIGLFEPEQVVLRETNPIDAIKRGIRETHSVMSMTYMTFVRLFQGSVKVENLKGPVGIAHIGTLIADRGLIWLTFFLALISVNLAVVNFLPVPITDGGHMLFLLYESMTGKPPPVAFQNAAMLVGMVFLGAIFLFVLYNDIRNLAG